PTQPTNWIGAPARPAATAWFAPFPPRTKVKSSPRNVSPGRGNLEENVVRSAVTDPATRTPSSLGRGETSGAVIACSVLRASLTLIPACYYISAIPGGRRRSGGQQCELHGSWSSPVEWCSRFVILRG